MLARRWRRRSRFATHVAVIRRRQADWRTHAQRRPGSPSSSARHRIPPCRRQGQVRHRTAVRTANRGSRPSAGGRPRVTRSPATPSAPSAHATDLSTPTEVRELSRWVRE